MESPKKFGFRPISGQSRSILWRFSAILHFGATKPDLPLCLLQIRTEAHLLNVAPLVLWFPESYKVFIGTRYSIVTPWEMGLPFSPVFGQIRRLRVAFTTQEGPLWYTTKSTMLFLVVFFTTNHLRNFRDPCGNS